MTEERVFNGDFAYPARIRRRGAKATHEQWFAEPAPFRVPVVAEAEAPVAISCRETVLNNDPVTAVYRLGPHGYLASAGSIKTLETVLAGRTPIESVKPHETFPAMRARPRGPLFTDEDQSVMRATVIDDRRAECLALATESAGRCVVVGDRFWRPCEPPMIVVQDHWYMDPFVTVRYVPHEKLPAFGMPFHVDDAAAAMDNAAWLSAHPWLHSRGAEIVPLPQGAKLSLTPDRQAFALSAARHVLGRLARSDVAPDFSTLPVGMLDAWLRFRRSEEQVSAGSIDAVAPAYEALADLHGRLPDLDAKRARNPSAAADVLRKRLEAPVHHWRTYLSGLVPSFDIGDDLGAVAALAR